MKVTLFLVCIFCAGSVVANGQTPASTPLPGQSNVTVINPRRDQVIFDTQRSTNPRTTQESSVTPVNLAYRKPTKEDLKLVAPDKEDAAKYADFLRHSKTGLVRLLSDQRCQENANLVVASDFCLKYKNLFGGSTFSFRTRHYTLGRFSDVVYKNGALYSIGKLTLGFLVDLGKDISLDNISAEATGARYVFDFQPPEDLPQIEAAMLNFQKGVENAGVKYQKFYALQENHTYLLRSVAYRKEPQVERNRRIYDDLTYDERKDVIVAFQVVRFGANKSDVTLLWKELSRKDAPKIEDKQAKK